jgi:hypothetical protein
MCLLCLLGFIGVVASIEPDKQILMPMFITVSHLVYFSWRFYWTFMVLKRRGKQRVIITMTRNSANYYNDKGFSYVNEQLSVSHNFLCVVGVNLDILGVYEYCGLYCFLADYLYHNFTIITKLSCLPVVNSIKSSEFRNKSGIRFGLFLTFHVLAGRICLDLVSPFCPR